MTIVTISRGTFTGGVAVAEGLAEELGCPCVSREVLREAAEKAGVSEERFQATLEEPPKFWQDDPDRVSAHLDLVRVALLQQVRDGGVVYHGYAGHLLLRGLPRVLRVRVIADFPSRVAAAMRDKQLDEKHATEFVKRLDGRLAKWTRLFYGVDWADPALYDLVVDLESLSVAGAVETLASAARLDELRATPEWQATFEDYLLASVVRSALSQDAHTRRARVRVAADAGSVSITGTADGKRTLEAITAVAAAAPGVASVTNDVGVGSDWQW